jgi:hypothetical protein
MVSVHGFAGAAWLAVGIGADCDDVYRCTHTIIIVIIIIIIIIILIFMFLKV